MVRINFLLNSVFYGSMSCAVYASTQDTASFEADSFQSVIASVDAGQVTIRDAENGTISWRYSGHPDKCRINSSVLGDGRLSLSSKSTQSGLPCEVDWVIGEPSSKPVKIDLGAGKVAVEAYAGSLELNVGQGDLNIQAPLKELKVDAGQISGTVANTNGNAIFKFGSGRLTYLWDFMPKSLQDLSFNIGSGEVTVEVPVNTPVQVKVDETPGFLGFGGFKAITEFENDQNPLVKVTGDGGSGRINVKKKR